MRAAPFLALVLATAALAGCGAAQSPTSGQRPSLRINRLQGTLVRVGRLHGQPLYGVRLRAFVCSRSAAEADRTYPTSFRVAHYVIPKRVTAGWPEAFRVMENELHWLVPLGETRGVCRDVDFEDVIPPSSYGGLESPLGCLGYCRRSRCYGVQLTLKAELIDHKRRTMSASRRAIVQCGRFRRPT